jgi:hypothetical protein
MIPPGAGVVTRAADAHNVCSSPLAHGRHSGPYGSPLGVARALVIPAEAHRSAARYPAKPSESIAAESRP